MPSIMFVRASVRNWRRALCRGTILWDKLDIVETRWGGGVWVSIAQVDELLNQGIGTQLIRDRYSAWTDPA